MRLYEAICTWIEASAFEKLAGAGGEEPHPEGNNFAHVEHGWQPSQVDWEDTRRISLRWTPEGR